MLPRPMEVDTQVVTWFNSGGLGNVVVLVQVIILCWL